MRGNLEIGCLSSNQEAVMKILVFAVCTLMVVAQSAEKLLEGARHKEVMGGDLKGP